jgi:hypothetical protein
MKSAAIKSTEGAAASRVRLAELFEYQSLETAILDAPILTPEYTAQLRIFPYERLMRHGIPYHGGVFHHGTAVVEITEMDATPIGLRDAYAGSKVLWDVFTDVKEIDGKFQLYVAGDIPAFVKGCKDHGIAPDLMRTLGQTFVRHAERIVELGGPITYEPSSIQEGTPPNGGPGRPLPDIPQGRTFGITL